MASTRVVLPWSTWAMMAMLRIVWLKAFKFLCFQPIGCVGFKSQAGAEGHSAPLAEHCRAWYVPRLKKCFAERGRVCRLPVLPKVRMHCNARETGCQARSSRPRSTVAGYNVSTTKGQPAAAHCGIPSFYQQGRFFGRRSMAIPSIHAAWGCFGRQDWRFALLGMPGGPHSKGLVAVPDLQKRNGLAGHQQL
jgi:hypothetical protein